MYTTLQSTGVGHVPPFSPRLTPLPPSQLAKQKKKLLFFRIFCCAQLFNSCAAQKAPVASASPHKLDRPSTAGDPEATVHIKGTEQEYSSLLLPLLCNHGASWAQKTESRSGREGEFFCQKQEYLRHTSDAQATNDMRTMTQPLWGIRKNGTAIV